MVKPYGVLTPEQLREQNALIVSNLIELYAQMGEGYCYEIAKGLREKIGKGSLITFSHKDANITIQHNTKNLYNAPLIEIPHSTTYQGQVQWAYHTVYELNGVVYSVELPYKWMYFKDYIKLMRRLNANNIVHNTEKQRENNKSSKS